MADDAARYLGAWIDDKTKDRRYFAIRGLPEDAPEDRLRFIRCRHVSEGDDLMFREDDIRYMSVSNAVITIHVQAHDRFREPMGPAWELEIKGRNLRHVAAAIHEGLAATLETFTPTRHDMPDDDRAPFIESMTDTAPRIPKNKRGEPS